jgi:uncharacterized lipoprotein YmbA
MMTLWVSAIALVLAGCTTFSAQPDPSRFFTLSAMIENPQSAAKRPNDAPRLSLGVGPVSIPGYLDRQEIVTRTAQNQVRLSEYDRWAEPLEEAVGRVVSQNVASILRAERITSYPWPLDRRPLYQVEIEVLRFEADSAQEAHLAARWTVRHTAQKALVRYNDTKFARTARERSTAASVAALSETLADLSNQIAASIEDLDRTAK